MPRLQVQAQIAEARRLLDAANAAAPALDEAKAALQTELDATEAALKELLSGHTNRRKALELATDPDGSRAKLNTGIKHLKVCREASWWPRLRACESRDSAGAR